MATKAQKHSLWDFKIFKMAIRGSFLKLVPKHQIRNPVMFSVYIGSLITTALFIQASMGQGEAPTGFILTISLWLWFTLIFANFAESMAEGRGKSQAQALKKARREILAKKLSNPTKKSQITLIQSALLRAGDIVLVEALDFILCFGLIEFFDSLSRSKS